MKKWWIVIIIILLAAGAGFGWWWLNGGQEQFGSAPTDNNPVAAKIYSNFTGLEISDNSLNSAPTFCVQIPNGSTDGARPQAGLTHAGVVFEAIAETGITRFAAIFQAPTTGIIGPIRSLRPYYLGWDTPFDCTIVHDGGSDEALAQLNTGNYRNLDEDFRYMWKVSDSGRLWNNVFTSPEKLLEFNHAHGYDTSAPQTFPRLTPDEVITAEFCSTDDDECDNSADANSISVKFTNLLDYMVNYTYDPISNTYLRSYANGDAHLVYNCPASVTDFSDCGALTQVAPSVVIAMHVHESTMADNYHEEIQYTGEGQAEIFQNGTFTSATWRKPSQTAQIQFFDTEGNEIKFTPGQIWISAVPQFGHVEWAVAK